MDLLPDDDQQALLESIAGMLRDEFPVDAARFRRSDMERLQSLADLGCYGLGIPEAQGGSGLGPAEETLLFAQLGRHLAPPGALAAVLGARLAVAAGRDDLAAAIVTGETPVAFAFPGSGEGSFYLADARNMPLIVHVSEAGAWLLPASAATERRELPSLDETVLLESARLDLAAEGGVTQEGPAWSQLCGLLVAALLVGLTESALAIAVGYAQIREQFGQPIGAFQAIKHPLARGATRADAGRWSCMLAALALAEQQPEAAFQVKAALLVAADAASSMAAVAVQVHGGMGYTAECAAHFHVKRTQLLQRLVGGLAPQREQFLELAPPAMIRDGAQLAVH